jgi:hypothetical protein
LLLPHCFQIPSVLCKKWCIIAVKLVQCMSRSYIRHVAGISDASHSAPCFSPAHSHGLPSWTGWGTATPPSQHPSASAQPSPRRTTSM